MADKTPRARSTKRSRLGRRELAVWADRILEEASEHEREFELKGMTSRTLPRAELIEKLSGRTAHSPFITQIGLGAPVRGSMFVLQFGLMNPDSWPYWIGNMGLCFCYADAGTLSDPGSTLLRAEPSVGVRQVEFGYLNAATTLYYLPADHLIPAGFRAGPADLNYFLYAPDAFAAGVLLERGTLRLDVA